MMWNWNYVLKFSLNNFSLHLWDCNNDFPLKIRQSLEFLDYISSQEVKDKKMKKVFHNEKNHHEYLIILQEVFMVLCVKKISVSYIFYTCKSKIYGFK